MTGVQRVRLQPAYILHRRPYRESSWLLELFSRDHGRLALIARGARKAGRQRLPLEPARELLVSWQMRGDLGVLQQAEAVAAGAAIGGASLLSVLYLNELLLRMTTRHDPHPALFECYRQTLLGFEGRADAEGLLRYFELDLLQTLGYGLNLAQDRNGAAILADVRYDFDLHDGARPLQGAVSGIEVGGDALQALQARRVDSIPARQEVKQLLRAAIASHLDRPLETRGLARRLRALKKEQPMTQVS